MDRAAITKLFLEKESKRKINAVKDRTNFEDIIHSSIGYLILNKLVPHETILSEIKNIQHLFVQHRYQHEESQGWYGFCIHGKSYDFTRESSYYNNTAEETWTKEAIEYMPQTVDFFKNNWFGNEFSRLRIMKLAPKGYINLHSDAAKPGCLNPVNIAINNPDGVKFVMEDWGIVPFQSGRCIMLNVSNLHAVVNESAEDRYHIIVHHKNITDAFKQAVVNSYAQNK